jgi:hypothetical protein
MRVNATIDSICALGIMIAPVPSTAHHVNGWMVMLLKTIGKILVTEEGCFGWRGTIQVSQDGFQPAS